MRRAIVALALSLSGGALLGACRHPLDEEQCDKLTDHLLELLAKSETDEARAEKLKAAVKTDKRAASTVRQACVGKMTRAELDCVLAATSYGEALACER
jgi:hypothetical protein